MNRVLTVDVGSSDNPGFAYALLPCRLPISYTSVSSQTQNTTIPIAMLCLFVLSSIISLTAV